MESTTKPTEVKLNRNSILNFLRRQAKDIHDDIKIEKVLKGQFWERAVPGAYSGEQFFKAYKTSKQRLAVYRKQLNTVNSLIRHIKKTVK